MVAKTVSQTLHFANDDDSVVVDIADDVIVRVRVPVGVQAMNFPLSMLEQVAGLLGEVADDEDVAALIAANTPEPVEPEPELEPAREEPSE